MTGVRAEVAVHGPAGCPVASFAAERETPARDVTWTRDGSGVVEEFRVDADGFHDEGDPADAEPVVEVGDERVYQFTRDPEDVCACEAVEALGTPVADIRAEPTALVLTLHLSGVGRLREVVEELDSVADRIEVRSVVHAATEGGGTEPVLVDRGRLTDRQREVLRTAYRMGYFEYPREANATEVADELGIGLSTLSEHLAAAQGKILADLLAT